MKKLTFGLMTIMLLIIFLPSQVMSETAIKTASIKNRAVESAVAKVLLTRLEVINKMDKSEMSFAEKRELRKEVRSINNKLKQLSGGIYLSLGAVIIILLLIILLQ